MLGVYLPPALQHGCPTLRALIERAHAASAKAAAAQAASAHAASARASAPASSAPEEEHRHGGALQGRASQGRAWQQGRLASLLGHGRSSHRAVSAERAAPLPPPIPATAPPTVPPVPHGAAATRCGARRCTMLLSRGGGRRGAVLMQLAARDEHLAFTLPLTLTLPIPLLRAPTLPLAPILPLAPTLPRYHQARDEQLLLEPLAHLFPYPAFCYLLSPCTADAEQRLTRGLQASHQPSPSLQPSSQPYPRP